MISVIHRKSSRATTKSMLFTVSKDEWNIKDYTGRQVGRQAGGRAGEQAGRQAGRQAGSWSVARKFY